MGFVQVRLKRMLSAKNAEQFRRSIKLELKVNFKMQSEFDKKKKESIYNNIAKIKIIIALYHSVPCIWRDFEVNVAVYYNFYQRVVLLLLIKPSKAKLSQTHWTILLHMISLVILQLVTESSSHPLLWPAEHNASQTSSLQSSKWTKLY